MLYYYTLFWEEIVVRAAAEYVRTCIPGSEDHG